jgi:hypothetical protein
MNVRDESPEHADSLANFGFAVTERAKETLASDRTRREVAERLAYNPRNFHYEQTRPGTSLTALVPGLFGFASGMSTSSSFAIRCGTPGCHWKCPMPDLGEEAFKNCYAEFAEHCVQAHGLKRDDMADAYTHLNLQTWTLTLLKR